MNSGRRHFFSLHELLVMAALAALGGMTGSVVSMAGKVVQGALGVPGGLQFLAGIHVLWLVIALGLVGKPGAATITGVLKGVVELLAGNPHGLMVVALSALGGLAVDAVWLLCGRRNHPIVYVLAGGAGAASNLLVFKVVASLPDQRGVNIMLFVLAGVAFLSGALLAGLLGWSLLQALRRAGVAGTQAGEASRGGGRRALVGLGTAWLIVALVGTATYVFRTRAHVEPGHDAAETQPAAADTMPPK